MLPGSRFTGTCWASTSGNPKVDKQLISQLATLEFTDAAQNLVLVGGTGTGKTHLATAIGVSGIQQHGKRVRFYSTRFKESSATAKDRIKSREKAQRSPATEETEPF